MDFFLSNFQKLSLLEVTVFYTFAGSFVIQFFYYLFFYSRALGFGKKLNNTNNEKPGISIVICAKNEADNLKKFLEKVLTQDYPKYQVVVVNDTSNDNTDEILFEFKRKYKHLYTTHLEEDRRFTHGKKLALTIGIKAAKYDRIALIDADCVPHTDQWLNCIVAAANNKSIVLGYGAYFKRKGLLNKLIRFETMFTGLQYLSFAKAGIPYMGVGRNMSYTKEVYNSVNGFSSHYHILSGDDDLFINQTAKGKNTAIMTDSNSIVYSVPKKTFKQYFQQKRRHLTTGKHYKFKHKFLLATEIVSRLLFYTIFVISLIFNNLWMLVLPAFGLRFLWQHIIFFKTGKTFKEKDLVYFTILFDIFTPLLNIGIVVGKLFTSKKNRYKW